MINLVRVANALSVAVLASCVICPGVARADEARPFYQGKTLQIVVGFDPGGYDLYARVIGRTLAKHLPGNPTIIVQNMPGAGSRVAANWLYNIAPKDGTVIGSVVQSTPIDQLLKEPGVMFDASKFNWIGNPIVDNVVSLSWAASGLSTLEDVKSKGGLICGSTGSGPSLTFPTALNKLLNSNVRIVSGYTSGPSVILAMQRNEVNCYGGLAWSSMKATASDMMKNHQLDVLVQWGAEPDPEISAYAGRNVPLATAYAQTDLDRNALKLISSTSAFSRPLLAPPGLPAERVEMLRDAFDQTMKDPEFLADAAKSKLDIRPLSGSKIQALVEGLVKLPQEDINRAIELSQ